ncbi:MAG TPA: 50S ribosomal protein L23 [Nitrospirae bacterium]|nr:50S ribosomal protein L23 [Nitrospirota bacterium]
MKTIYNIIKKPLFTEKGMQIKEKDNKILLEVDTKANKHEIKDAVEKIFKVKVAKVSTINEIGKLKKFGRFQGMAAKKKKAIITLKQGEKLDLIEGV